jgi:AmpE protein
VASAFLAILIVVVLGHVLPEYTRLRDYGWFRAWLASAERSLGEQRLWRGGAGLLVSLGVPLLGVGLLQFLSRGQFYGLLTFLLGLVALYYAWGPRDLDLDAEAAAAAPEGEPRRAAFAALAGHPADGHDAAVTAVMEAALVRWFGTLFWFLLLGAVGAIGYRLVQLCARTPEFEAALPPAQRELARRLAALLDWPVAHLMTLALAVAADFDRVLHTWREWHAGERRDPLSTSFLASAALALVRVAEEEEGSDGAGDALASALQQALALCWRVLIVWLVVLALMVLAGFIG